MMNLKKKSVPLKNYFYLFLVILGTFLLVFYVYLWYKTYKDDELNKSVISNYLDIINYNEIDNYVLENGNAVIYVSKLGDRNIINFEKNFKSLIVKNDLRDSILYLDVSNEGDYINKFNINNNLPYIIIYTDGKITNKYDISSSNFNIKKLDKYLNRIGVIEND